MQLSGIIINSVILSNKKSFQQRPGPEVTAEGRRPVFREGRVNNIHTSHKIGLSLKSAISLGVLIASTVITGCMGIYGKLHWDPQVTAAFQTHEVRNDFNYFYYGAGNQIFAIVGISPDYVLESKMWREARTDAEAFNILISRAWINDYYSPQDPQGAYILNPEGKQVGIWYSSLRFITVKFVENNRIVIIPDTPFLGGPEASSGGGDSGGQAPRVESSPPFSYPPKNLLAADGRP
jgi:hypothetical protein